MWQRMKNLTPPKLGDKMILVEIVKNEIGPENKRLECEVTDLTEHIITVTCEKGYEHQFEFENWNPIKIRPRHRLFPSNEKLDDMFEHATLLSRFAVAFGLRFSSSERYQFTTEQLREAAKVLGLDDVS